MNNLAINPAVAFGTNNNTKKSSTKRKLAIGAAVVGTAAAITAGVVYRKNIMDVLKTGVKKIQKLFGKKAKPATVFDSTPGYSKETKGLIKDEIVKMFSNETIKAEKVARAAELKKMRLDAIAAFKNLKVDA